MSPGLMSNGKIWGTAVAWIQVSARVRQYTRDSISGGDEHQALELHDYGEGFHPDGEPSTIAEEDIVRSVQPWYHSQSIKGSVKAFWGEQICVHIGHEECRDHYALERTFLGYMRTSVAFAMLGIYIAQLFRLQHTLNPGAGFGFFTLGVPLACLCTFAAFIIAVLGAYRFWRQQNAMLRGKIHVWGWEMAAIAITAFVVTLILFVLLIAVDADNDPASNLGPEINPPQR